MPQSTFMSISDDSIIIFRWTAWNQQAMVEESAPGKERRRHMHTPGPGERVSTPLVLLLAVSCGLAVANLYYPQPLLPSIAASLHTGPRTAGLVVTAAQVGYAVGLALLVPLGDILPRRRVVPAVLVLTTVALGLSSVATGIATLIALALFVGAGSVAAQLLIPLAASLADDTSRGRVVGTVMTGLLMGILLARTVAGLVAGYSSWRVMYVTAAVLALALAATLARILPAETAQAPLSYGQLLRSTAGMWHSEPVLRRRCFLGALGFAAFSVFWTTAAFLLGGSPYHYSETVIGLFGLLGAAGAGCAALAGRVADRGHAPLATAAGAAAIAASFALLHLGEKSLIALIAGVIVLDVGVQAVHVLNQNVIYALAPAARSRINANYMVSYFAGGAAGSAASSTLYAAGGWAAVCAFGGAIGLAALGVWAYDQLRSQRASGQRGSQLTPA
jgi:predicted MFS family arabinose efflux permease